MPRALISVSDKRGIVSFARGLIGQGWEVISTGGTANTLRKGGLHVTDVAEVTGFPETMPTTVVVILANTSRTLRNIAKRISSCNAAAMGNRMTASDSIPRSRASEKIRSPMTRTVNLLR